MTLKPSAAFFSSFPVTLINTTFDSYEQQNEPKEEVRDTLKTQCFPGTVFAVAASPNRIVRVSSDFLLERSSVFLAA